MKAMVIHEMVEYTYGQEGLKEIGTLCDLIAKPMSFDEARTHPDALAQVEAIFSGWKYRQMDASFLDLCPNLKIVFYAGGTIHRLVSDAFWERGIRICSAWAGQRCPGIGIRSVANSVHPQAGLLRHPPVFAGPGN